MYKQLYGLPAASVVQWLAHQSDTQLAVAQPCIVRKVFENTTAHWQVLVQNPLQPPIFSEVIQFWMSTAGSKM